MINESGAEKAPPIDWDPVAKALADTLITICRWQHAYEHGHLFLVADPTQGFLGRGASWKSLGLEARGHTHNLRRSYRTTREIMQFATLLYRLRLTDEKDEDILVPDLLNMPTGSSHRSSA